MRIAYIGPEGRNHIVQSWASPGVAVETRSANFNGAIESSYDEYLYIPNLLAAVEQIERDGFDAALVGCLGDPGLDAVRELAGAGLTHSKVTYPYPTSRRVRAEAHPVAR